LEGVISGIIFDEHRIFDYIQFLEDKACNLNPPTKASAHKRKSTIFSVFENSAPIPVLTTCPRMVLTATIVSKTPGHPYTPTNSPIVDTISDSLITIIVPDKVHPLYTYFDLEITITLKSSYNDWTQIKTI
jgi:hypothetical protein